MKCKFKFKGRPGPVQCPTCGHLYIQWLNYKLWGNIYERYLERN